ncbi:serine/threonine-protein kinase pim-2-like [Myxocyprinus asiaticus]|uniref:serine/threonine-protein kinase pim-2-like n=1 Tax=Myxocyprinus asiaticus TaxID=70543 RepID=UPI002222ACB6|nr:serine/threonine-protein kinase pim-2-like [Myxocyprinus asiaticus]
MSPDDNIFFRYKPILGNKLGEGGYEDIFEGICLENGLKVAVKFATKMDNMVYMTIPGHPKPIPSEVALHILANKGPSVGQIIQLLDWQEEAEYYIMVTECPSPYETMFDFLKCQGGNLNEGLAWHMMWQATLAAEMCCLRGVLHRNLKLENLLVSSDTPDVKLINSGCGDLLKDSAYKTFYGTDVPPKVY